MVGAVVGLQDEQEDVDQAETFLEMAVASDPTHVQVSPIGGYSKVDLIRPRN